MVFDMHVQAIGRPLPHISRQPEVLLQELKKLIILIKSSVSWEEGHIVEQRLQSGKIEDIRLVQESLQDGTLRFDSKEEQENMEEGLFSSE